MTTSSLSRTLIVVALAALAAIAVLVGLLLSGGGAARAASPALLAAPGSLAAASAPVGSAVAAPGVTVVGTASASGTPDTLRLDLGVMVTKGSVSEAMAAANSSMAAVQKALRDNGVAEKDLRSSALSVQPQYDYSNNSTPRITGYTVIQGVVATLRDVEGSGKVIEAATRAGGDATVVNGIGLDIDDPEGVLATARAKAIENARAKAKAYADAAGLSVGQVVSITETSAPGTDVPMAYAASEKAMVGGAVPISAGSQEYSVTVTVTFAFE